MVDKNGWQLGGLNKSIANQKATNLWRGNGARANCEVLSGVTRKDANQLADVGLYMMTHPENNANDLRVDVVPPRGPVELTSSQRDELAVQAQLKLRSLGTNEERAALLNNALQDDYQPSVPDDYRHNPWTTKGRDLRSLVYGTR